MPFLSPLRLGRSARNKLIGGIIVTALVAAFPTFCMVAQSVGLIGVERDWFFAVNAASLVRNSDRIVIARYLDESIYETPNSPQSHRSSPIEFVDSYRRFEVVESLTGDFAAGDSAYVRWSEGYYRKDANGEPEFIERPAVQLTYSEAYVLFLNRNPGRRPPDLDVEIEIWRTSEGLVAARIDSNGQLSFKTNAYYREALKDMDLKPVDGSGAPFQLTVDGIRKIVANSVDPAPH